MKVKESEKACLQLNIQKTKIMTSGPITSWQREGETMETVADFIFEGSKITADGDWSHKLKRCLFLGRKAMTNLNSLLKKQRHHFANKGPSSQGYGFSSSHVWMSELDYKETWAPKNWCLWTVLLEKTLESPLDCKEIKPVNPKGSQPWIFTGRTEAETPILWTPDAKNCLLRKDPDAGKDWRQEEKEMTQDKMVEWHHRLDGLSKLRELGMDRDGQGSWVCCSLWGRKVLDMTERLNWTEQQKDTIFLWNPLYWNITMWAFCWFWRWITCGYLGLQIFLCIPSCLLHSSRFPLSDTCFEIEVGRIFLVLVYFPLL